MSEKGKNKSNMPRDLKRFFKLLGKNRNAYLFWMLMCIICSAAAHLVYAETLRNLIGYFVEKEAGFTLLTVALLIAAAVLYDCVIGQIFNYFSSRVETVMIADIRKSLFAKLQTLPVGHFRESHSGDVVARINGDITAVTKAADSLWGMCQTLFGLIVFIPYLTVLDWRMAVIVVVCGLLSALLTAKVIRPLREKYRQIRDSISRMSTTTTESVTGFNVTKMYLLQDKFSKDFSDSVDEVYETQKKFGNMEALIGFCRMIVNYGGNAVATAIGVVFAFGGTLAISSLAAMTDICRGVINYIDHFTGAPAELQKAFSSTDRLFELFDSHSEPERYDIDGDDPEAGVMIRDLVFGYNGDVNVLDGVSIRAAKGEMIALVGDSGSGKTTLVKLIAGLYEPKSARMTVCGKPLREQTLTQLRANIAYVPQDAYIFNGNIEENIAYGLAEAEHGQIVACARRADAEEFIMQKPDGYDTQVGERGIQLSGGERQRIAIARAMLKDAPLLLLDEATSSLDSESELAVQAALEKLMKGRTSVVVAHRLSTIVNADRIYMMRAGKVIGEGRHAELLESCPDYRALYEKKFAV